MKFKSSVYAASFTALFAGLMLSELFAGGAAVAGPSAHPIVGTSSNATATAAHGDKAHTVTLKFPAEYSLGALSLCYANAIHVRPSRTVPAQGTVTVNVPPLAHIALEVNSRIIGEHPERLANIPLVGVDQINLTYMSMEDNSSACDKALAAMPEFKHPMWLVCPRTDLTDAGLISFKSLGTLVHLDCFMSGLDGRFLKDTKRLQNLKVLNLSNNAIKAEHEKNLSALTKMESLDLALTDLTDEAMQTIGKLQNLKGLYIASNPKVTDAGLQCIQNCTKIQVLDLSYCKGLTDKAVPTLHKLKQMGFLKLDATKFSAASLEQLKDMTFETMVIPKTYWKVDEEKLKRAFKPGVVRTDSRLMDKEIQAELGPLK